MVCSASKVVAQTTQPRKDEADRHIKTEAGQIFDPHCCAGSAVSRSSD